MTAFYAPNEDNAVTSMTFLFPKKHSQPNDYQYAPEYE